MSAPTSDTVITTELIAMAKVKEIIMELSQPERERLVLWIDDVVTELKND